MGKYPWSVLLLLKTKVEGGLLMKNFVFVFISFIMLFIGCAGSQPSVSTTTSSTVANDNMTLDQALAEAARRIEERITAGSKIAPLNFNSSSDRFSVYVLEELTANLVENGKLIVVDRSEIDLIRSEFNFQYSGEVGDDSMQALGRMLGAQSIISGSLTDMGGFYRIMIRVLNVQNASVEVQYRTNIINDQVVTALLSGGRTTAVVISPGSGQTQQTMPAQPQTQQTVQSPTPAVETSSTNQNVLSWPGTWLRVGTNTYTNPTIGHNQVTWETLTINAPPGGIRIRVRLTASSEGADYGFATVINGSRSTASSNIQDRVSGTETKTINYNIPSGRHEIHFGYSKDSSISQGNDNVTVEVTIIQ
jgi:TolB-like protein